VTRKAVTGKAVIADRAGAPGFAGADELRRIAEHATHLHATGLAATDDDRPALAARRYRAALRTLDAAESALPELRARVLVSLAWAESERGQVDNGFRLLDQAEPLLPPDRRAVLRAQRALLLKRSGRNELALREYDAAVAGLSEQDSALDLVKALNNRSLVHLEAGRVGQARDDLRRCMRIASGHGLALNVAICRINLGCLYVVAGDLPAALRAFAVARREYETLAPGRLPELAVERARALVAAGLSREADLELAFATGQAHRLQQSHVYADALQTRAEAALLAGRPQAVADWAGQARDRFLERRNARRAALAELLVLRAQFAEAPALAGPALAGPALAGPARALAARLYRLGLPEDARVAALVGARSLLRTAQAGPAKRLAERYGPPGHIDRLDTRLLWRLTHAELAAADGRPNESSRHLVAGMTTLHRHRARFGCLDLQTGASAHGQDLARAGLAAALAGGALPAIYRWSERARAQALLLPPARPPDDPAASAALEDLRQTRNALREAELTGRPAAALRAQAEKLQHTVREQSWSSPGREDTGGASPAPLGAVRSQLGDAALVAYLRDGMVLRALVLAGSSTVLVTLGEVRVAEEAVLRLRADLDTMAGRAMPVRLAQAVAAATRRDAAALAAAVLDPLLSLIGDRDLVVVPTGLLMTTPWAVLAGCRGRAVTVAPSATAWLAAIRRRPAGDGRVVLAAGPGNERGEPEVRAIAALHPSRTVVLTGPEASPAATLAALDGASVAHLAAHGSHQAENALFSTLELYGGPVLGYDLQRLAVPPGMVVLSSCELGLGDVRPGDESFGLATALLAAGSATVVASVSRVADDTAMTVMVAYHRAIAAGAAPAAALAAAAPETTGFVCLGAG
jgi:tetratricopeptide (TPR) repeat protein